MRPDDADIFFVVEDEREGLVLEYTKRLLLAGEASVLDVNPQGKTLLKVGGVLFLYSSRTLICSVVGHLLAQIRSYGLAHQCWLGYVLRR